MPVIIARRELIAALGGAVAAWPIAARAQQPERIGRIGVLMNSADGDPEGLSRVAAFQRTLAELHWIAGRNLQIDARWAAGDAELLRRCSEELVALAPDVILASASSSVAALQRVTRTVPIVFANVIDPGGAGSRATTPLWTGGRCGKFRRAAFFARITARRPSTPNAMPQVASSNTLASAPAAGGRGLRALEGQARTGRYPSPLASAPVRLCKCGVTQSRI